MPNPSGGTLFAHRFGKALARSSGYGLWSFPRGKQWAKIAPAKWMNYMSIGPSLWNIEALRAITDGNVELEGKLIGLYIQTVERCFSRLRDLVHRDIYKDWPKIVHELKGASANIHAEQMAFICKHAQKADDPIARKLALEDLEAAYLQLRPMISSLIRLQ